MDLNPEPKKKKKSNLPIKKKPSVEEADAAMELIKVKEKETAEELKKKEIQEAEEEQKRQLKKKEQELIQLAQEKIRRVLRENLKKKEKQDNIEKTKNYLEKGDKIKWKSINLGSKLEGYVEDKLVFEIKRGLTVFNLYLKNKALAPKNNKKSYQGCSTNIQKLKELSESLLKPI